MRTTFVLVAVVSIVLALLGLVWAEHWWGRWLTYLALVGVGVQLVAAFGPTRRSEGRRRAP